MIYFQWLGFIFLAILMLATLGRMRRRAAWGSNVGWLVLWMSAGLAIAFPDLTMVVAKWLGIGRGADLVFYCAILGMLAGFFVTYKRMRRLESDITRLVRHLAIQEADTPSEE